MAKDETTEKDEKDVDPNEYPRMLYKDAGDTRVVASADEEADARAAGWSRKPGKNFANFGGVPKK